MADAPNPLTLPCDVWVLPLPASSKWFARIDWYLNWQLCKGLAFERRRPSVELFRVIEESGMHYSEVVSEADTPLMVISQHRVPASKCVVVAPEATLKAWLKRVLALMAELKAEHVRVFLPTGEKAAKARDLLQELNAKGLRVDFTTDEDAP